LWTAVQFVWATIKTIIEVTLKVIQGIIQIVTGIISGDWGKVWQGIKTIFSGVWDGIKDTVHNAMDLVKGTVKAGIDAAYNLVHDLPGRILRGLGNLGSVLFNAGADLIKGLINGIGSMIDAVKNKVGDTLKGAVDFGKKLIGLGSPSKLTHQWGVWFGQGLANGITESGDLINKAMQSLAPFSPGPVTMDHAISAGQGMVTVGGGGAGGGVNVAPGAFQLIVQGNLDQTTLPAVQKMIDSAFAELTRQLK